MKNFTKSYLKNHLIAGLILSYLTCHSVVGSSISDPLKFGSNENSAEQEVAEIVFKKINESLGVHIEVEHFPPARANTYMTSGRIVGEIARVEYYGKTNPDLIRVDPPYYKFTTNGFCLGSSSINIRSYQDLKKYSVAIIRGVIHSQLATEGHPKVLTVNTSAQMFELVKAKRVEVAIDNGINGKRFLRNGNLDMVKDCGTAATLDLYLYLNSSSANYAKMYSQEFTKLKKSRSLDKMINEAEEEVMAKKSRFGLRPSGLKRN